MTGPAAPNSPRNRSGWPLICHSPVIPVAQEDDDARVVVRRDLGRQWRTGPDHAHLVTHVVGSGALSLASAAMRSVTEPAAKHAIDFHLTTGRDDMNLDQCNKPSFAACVISTTGARTVPAAPSPRYIACHLGIVCSKR